MSEYTPTTDEVREAVNEWVWSRRMWRPELSPSGGMEFDRWLAGITAERDAALSTIAKVEALVEEVIEAHSDRIGNHYAEYCYKRHVECFASVLRSRALGSVPSTGEGNE